MRGKGKVSAHLRVEDGAWFTFKDTATPSPSSRRQVCRTVRVVTANQNSAGPKQNSTPMVLTFTKGLILTKRARRKIFKIKESEREELNLIFKGVIGSPK